MEDMLHNYNSVPHSGSTVPMEGIYKYQMERGPDIAGNSGKTELSA